MYIKEFEIRWRDLDANKHLGNSSYVDFMSHTRMSFFLHNGLDLKEMERHELGPIVFSEHIYYFKEVLLGSPIKVSLEMEGMSEDARFVKIVHKFFDTNGINLARGEMLFSWINLKTRKLGNPSEDLKNVIRNFPKANNFRILDKEELQSYRKNPEDLKI